MAAWRGLERGDEVRELRPWLHRIAHNTQPQPAAPVGLRLRRAAGARLRIADAPDDELEPPTRRRRCTGSPAGALSGTRCVESRSSGPGSGSRGDRRRSSGGSQHGSRPARRPRGSRQLRRARLLAEVAHPRPIGDARPTVDSSGLGLRRRRRRRSDSQALEPAASEPREEPVAGSGAVAAAAAAADPARIGPWSADLEPIREGLRAAGADALWIHPGVDLRHLTGLAPIAMERPTALVVLADGGAARARARDARARAGRDRGRRRSSPGATATGRRRRSRACWTASAGCSVGEALPAGVAFALKAARPGLDARARPGRPRRRCASASAPTSSSTCAPPAATPTTRPPGSPPRGSTAHGARARAAADDPLPRGGRRPLRPTTSSPRAPHGALPHHVTGETRDRPRASRCCATSAAPSAGYHSDITRVYLPDGRRRRGARGAGDRPRRPRRRDRRPRAGPARPRRPTGSPAT